MDSGGARYNHGALEKECLSVERPDTGKYFPGLQILMDIRNAHQRPGSGNRNPCMILQQSQYMVLCEFEGLLVELVTVKVENSNLFETVHDGGEAER
jgi:hypothetical protein